MITSQSPIETTASPEEEMESWTPVGRYASLHQAYDHGLVILAMGEACRVTESDTQGEYLLEAEAHPIPRIEKELDAYQKESAIPTADSQMGRDGFRHSSGWPMAGLWVLILIAVYLRQGEDPTLIDRAASSSIGLFDRDEWWRPFTALFLHGSIGHLLGNLVSGVIFGALVARSMGSRLGWFLILACGTLGNAITARITYPQAFISIGASTAVFAALGILAGYASIETLREKVKQPWLRTFAPIFAGVILLGWLGGGHDPSTDVLGHVFGFGSGLAAGAIVGKFEAIIPEPPAPA
jgi:rhomboid protease GluP